MGSSPVSSIQIKIFKFKLKSLKFITVKVGLSCIKVIKFNLVEVIIKLNYQPPEM